MNLVAKARVKFGFDNKNEVLNHLISKSERYYGGNSASKWTSVNAHSLIKKLLKP